MGNLPATRVNISHPFEYAGVDFTGSFNLCLSKSRSKGTCKGYIAVFICFSTRAVHLEPVKDLSTEAFIAAFSRFSSRRGHCRELYSDNGTNFVGADAQLKSMFSRASEQSTSVASLLSKDGTTWKFNPPSAPHCGGYWEAAVKSVKHHLRRVLGDSLLTFVELSTLLCKIEACINSRPLSALSDDPSDLNALVPAHFLILRLSFLVPEPDYTQDHVPIGRRWLIVTQKAQHFWARWSTEYLTTLQGRAKWTTAKSPVKVGDLVLVRSEITPPGKWPFSRVTETLPDAQGQIRICTVRTATGSLCRHVTKLVLLDSANNTLLF